MIIEKTKEDILEILKLKTERVSGNQYREFKNSDNSRYFKIGIYKNYYRWSKKIRWNTKAFKLQPWSFKSRRLLSRPREWSNRSLIQ